MIKPSTEPITEKSKTNTIRLLKEENKKLRGGLDEARRALRTSTLTAIQGLLPALKTSEEALDILDELRDDVKQYERKPSD